jgi:hypothetical protein
MQEQLNRWQESETNRLSSAQRRADDDRKVKFQVSIILYI